MTLFPLAATNATSRPAAGVTIPDSKLAREVTELVRDTESPLLFHHSSRVYYWGALTGKRRGLRFDPELLYAGAMFHDMGLTSQYASADKRFEVDSANTAGDFLRRHEIDAQDIQTVWTAIALHTTPGTPQYMHPVIALVTAGVEMDVLGIAFSELSDAEREAVVLAHPRPDRFKEEIIQAFYKGFHHRPETTFGNVNADVLADKDPSFPAPEFLSRDPRLCLARLGPARSARCLWPQQDSARRVSRMTEAANGLALGVNRDPPVAFAHGLTILVFVAALGDISGGHFNPAVTTGLEVAGVFPCRRVVPYLIAQLAGSIRRLAAVARFRRPGQ